MKRINQALYGKMKTKLRDADAAMALVRAGFDTPKKLREASDKDIKEFVTADQLANVRARIS